MKDKINTIKEYDFLIYAFLGLVSGIVFLNTFQHASDFFTREALAAESLILSIIFSTVLVNTLLSSLLKKRTGTTEVAPIIEQKQETYFSKPTEQTKSFVSENDLIPIAAATTVAVAYEWEEEEVIDEKRKNGNLGDAIDHIAKEQKEAEQKASQSYQFDNKEEDDEEDFNNIEVDYTAGFVPEKNESPFG